MHGLGGIHKVTSLLEHGLIGQGAAPDAQGGIGHRDVRSALQLGVLAEALDVIRQSSVPELHRVLNSLAAVQGRRQHAQKTGANLHTVMVIMLLVGIAHHVVLLIIVPLGSVDRPPGCIG